MPNKLTTDEFVRRARDVHGDKYGYSLVEYKGVYARVSIVCPLHGEFQQTPNAHIYQGSGCQKCGGMGFSPEERFWSFVDKNGDTRPGMESPCWKWTGAKAHGYGRIDGGQGRPVGAHVLSWRIHYGEIPLNDRRNKRFFVLHRCDNPECTRPDHLFLGDTSDNSLDMARKGRSTHGEQSWHAKLTPDAVYRIREIHAGGGYSHQRLADRFGVSRKSIGNIINHKTWVHYGT